jgi:DNA-binding response OmpR family regulator
MAIKMCIAKGTTKATLKPDVLLVEPDPELMAKRALLLMRSSYLVITACDTREVFVLRGSAGPLIAVLNDALGDFQLHICAEFVRRHWPSTRILVLGAAYQALEDHLYDDAVEHDFKPEDFLDTLERLLEDPWKQRS